MADLVQALLLVTVDRSSAGSGPGEGFAVTGAFPFFALGAMAAEWIGAGVEPGEEDAIPKEGNRAEGEHGGQ